MSVQLRYWNGQISQQEGRGQGLLQNKADQSKNDLTNVKRYLYNKVSLKGRGERLNKFSDEQFIQPRICVEASQILLIAEQNLKFCSRPQRKALRNGGKDEEVIDF